MRFPGCISTIITIESVQAGRGTHALLNGCGDVVFDIEPLKVNLNILYAPSSTM